MTPLDEALSEDGRTLYVLAAGSHGIVQFAVGEDGTLSLCREPAEHPGDRGRPRRSLVPALRSRWGMEGPSGPSIAVRLREWLEPLGWTEAAALDRHEPVERPVDHG